jgi:hypothetical protein
MKVRRFVTGLAAVAAAVAAPVASAVAASPPRASLTGFACTHALDPGNRAIGIQAVMRPLAATRRLAIRFELLERGAGLPVQTVGGGDLGAWKTPNDATLGQLPGDVWRLQKSVYNLDVPAIYQFRVSFRWTGARAKVLGTAVRYSRTCHLRELRPDLLVSSLTISAIPNRPKKELYTAVIANQGFTGAGPFEVLFAPGDTSAPAIQNVQFLAAGDSRTLSFVGPLCDKSNPPTVSADATSQVDDSNRANNVATAVCAAAAGS